MSSARWRILAILASQAIPAEVWAQAGDQPNAVQMAASQREALVEALNRPSECLPDGFQPDTIVVCGEMAEDEAATRAAMLPLPAPVRSDRLILREIERPPCWVEPTGGVCVRGGYAPPPVVLIGLTAIPLALTPEEEALVFDADAEAGEAR